MRYLLWQQKLGEWHPGLCALVRAQTHLRGVYWWIFSPWGRSRPSEQVSGAVLMNCHCAIPDTARPPMRSARSATVPSIAWGKHVNIYISFQPPPGHICFWMEHHPQQLESHRGKSKYSACFSTSPSSKYLNIPAAWTSCLLVLFSNQKSSMLPRSDEEEVAFISRWGGKKRNHMPINQLLQSVLVARAGAAIWVSLRGKRWKMDLNGTVLLQGYKWSGAGMSCMQTKVLFKSIPRCVTGCVAQEAVRARARGAQTDRGRDPVSHTWIPLQTWRKGCLAPRSIRRWLEFSEWMTFTGAAAAASTDVGWCAMTSPVCTQPLWWSAVCVLWLRSRTWFSRVTQVVAEFISSVCGDVEWL